MQHLAAERAYRKTHGDLKSQRRAHGETADRPARKVMLGAWGRGHVSGRSRPWRLADVLNINGENVVLAHESLELEPAEGSG
jgi:hypothetical protein